MVQYKQNFPKNSICILKSKASTRAISTSTAGSWLVCPVFPFSAQGCQEYWYGAELLRFLAQLGRRAARPPRRLFASSANTCWAKTQLILFLNHLPAYLASSSYREPALGQQHGHLHCFFQAPRLLEHLGSSSGSHSDWQKDLTFLFLQ